AIRMLTVHKAKGLEFPCVVLANLGARGNPHHPPLVFDRLAGRAEVRVYASDVKARLAMAGYTQVATLEREREQAEEHRLLYVAATRARDYLVVADFAATRAAGYIRDLREVPGALGGSTLGALPEPSRPGRSAPGPGDAWCVIASDELDPPGRPQRGGAAPASVEALLESRGAWTSEQMARLRRGGGRGAVLRTADLAWCHAEDVSVTRRSADTRRVGLVTHRVLERLPPLASPDVQEAYVREAATSLHALGTKDEVLGLVGAVRRSEIESRAVSARGLWRGVRLTTRVGAHLIEALLDLVFEEDDGFTVVDYSTSAPGDQTRALEEEALELRALALAATGRRVREAGTFFLRVPRYVPLDRLEDRLEARQKQLGAAADA
ncbi:MAG: 3'-5' exonuclease, partial [Candidatus Krumholzibacteriia bacterium]